MKSEPIWTGKHVGVAVFDTGIFEHQDFGDRIRGFTDFVQYRGRPYDDNSHGTHVAGILGGSGAGCRGKYKGTAPECDLIGVKVLDQYGSGRKEVILQAFRWLLHNYDRLKIRVVNISVGTTCNTHRDHRSLIEGVEALWDAGLVVVTAAGNQGPLPGSVTAPGSSKKVITVGSSDMLTHRKDASGRGPTGECVCKPDVVAPGYQVMSCIPGGDGRSAYGVKSGTSMSTPYVSGYIARILEKDPHLTNMDVKMLLRESTRDLGQPRNVQGWGLFDPDKFLKL